MWLLGTLAKRFRRVNVLGDEPGAVATQRRGQEEGAAMREAVVTAAARPRAGPVLWIELAGAAAAWLTAYRLNAPLWTWLFRDVAGLDLRSPIGGALHFFFYDTTKIFLLLTGLMFVIGMLRASLDLEKARSYLEGRGLFVGLFLAAGIPLAITLTFLIASPLVSEIAAIMIGDHFGWGIAAAYVTAGSTISMAIGFVLSRFSLEPWVEETVFATKIGQLRQDEPVVRAHVLAADGERLHRPDPRELRDAGQAADEVSHRKRPLPVTDGLRRDRCRAGYRAAGSDDEECLQRESSRSW